MEKNQVCIWHPAFIQPLFNLKITWCSLLSSFLSSSTHPPAQVYSGLLHQPRFTGYIRRPPEVPRESWLSYRESYYRLLKFIVLWTLLCLMWYGSGVAQEFIFRFWQVVGIEKCSVGNVLLRFPHIFSSHSLSQVCSRLINPRWSGMKRLMMK